MLGEDLYETLRDRSEGSWEERKTAQNRRLFDRHPDQVWVLERDARVFGYVTFWLIPEKSYGHLDNNAVHPDVAGRGWATFMYREPLRHFHALGLRYAHVDTGLDDAHIRARRAYEAVGFDRRVPTVDYWVDLAQVAGG